MEPIRKSASGVPLIRQNHQAKPILRDYAEVKLRTHHWSDQSGEYIAIANPDKDSTVAGILVSFYGETLLNIGLIPRPYAELEAQLRSQGLRSFMYTGLERTPDELNKIGIKVREPNDRTDNGYPAHFSTIFGVSRMANLDIDMLLKSTQHTFTTLHDKPVLSRNPDIRQSLVHATLSAARDISQMPFEFHEGLTAIGHQR